MRVLVTPAKWTLNTVTEQEANAFKPGHGHCCDSTYFRVHLAGTTCDTWNKSAISVFIEDFLRTHPEYPNRVRDMVQVKSRAALDSAIREYRKSLVTRDPRELEEMRKEKNRLERKRKVSSNTSIPSHHEIVTSCASSTTPAVMLRSSTRPSHLTFIFWTNSEPKGCPAMKSEL